MALPYVNATTWSTYDPAILARMGMAVTSTDQNNPQQEIEKEAPLPLVIDEISGQEVTLATETIRENVDYEGSGIRQRIQGPLVFDRTGQSLTRGFTVRFYQEVLPGFVTEGIGYVESVSEHCVFIRTRAGSIKHEERRAVLTNMQFQFPLYRAINGGRMYAFNPGKHKKEWVEVLHPRMQDIPTFDIGKLRV